MAPEAKGEALMNEASRPKQSVKGAEHPSESCILGPLGRFSQLSL